MNELVQIAWGMTQILAALSLGAVALCVTVLFSIMTIDLFRWAKKK